MLDHPGARREEINDAWGWGGFSLPLPGRFSALNTLSLFSAGFKLHTGTGEILYLIAANVQSTTINNSNCSGQQADVIDLNVPY